MGIYAASSGLLECGVVSGLDITPEAALAKMMWILATETDPEEISVQMQINQRGEQTGNLFDLRYGPGGNASNALEVASQSARPSGQFRKSRLSRAVLRVSGLGLDSNCSNQAITCASS